jgi:hypothetical protein
MSIGDEAIENFVYLCLCCGAPTGAEQLALATSESGYSRLA